MDLNKNFKGLNGEEVAFSQEAPQVRTIAEQIRYMLFTAQSVPDRRLTKEDKWMAYQICRKISADPSDVQLTVDERALVENLAGDYFIAGLFGQVVELLQQE